MSERFQKRNKLFMTSSCLWYELLARICFLVYVIYVSLSYALTLHVDYVIGARPVEVFTSTEIASDVI